MSIEGDNQPSRAVAISMPAMPAMSSKIPQLTKDNFQSWKDLIDLFMEINGLQDALVSDEVDKQIDMNARLILLQSMDESHRSQVRSCKTAKAIVDRLKTVYADTSAANIYRLLSKFYSYKKLDNDTVSEHIGKFDEMRQQLADLKEKVSDQLYQVMLINSLPEAYHSILEMWEITHPEMRTTQNLVTRLFKREEDLKNQSEVAQAMLVKKTGPRRQVDEIKKKTSCHACGEVGHWAGDYKCPKKKDRRRAATRDADDSNETAIASNVIFNTGNLSSHMRFLWIADSGATQHMCNQLEWFSEFKPVDKPVVASVGDGNKVEVLGIGSVPLINNIDGKEVRGVLTNVIYVPALTSNLFSIGASSKQGISSHFFKDTLLLKLKNQVVLKGTRSRENLYVLNVRAEKFDPKLFKATMDINELHRALGHPTFTNIKQILKNTDEIQTTGAEKTCATCPQGKATHAEHPSSTRKPAEKPGERVHSDLVTIKQGSLYYLLSKDEASEISFVNILSSKTQVHAALVELIKIFERESGQLIKTFLSDNGSEFVNLANQRLFANEKIIHDTSSPYTPQQNGFIEREVRTISTIARTLINATSLGEKLLPEAIKTACYLKNRLPTRRSVISPFERFTGRKPCYSNLVEFGREVQILKTDHRVSKFESRTIPGYVVGYTNRRNTLRVYIPELQKVIETCNIVFAPHPPTIRSSQPHAEQEMTVQLEGLQLHESPSNRQAHRDETSSITDASNCPWANSTPNQPRIGKNGKPYLEPEEVCKFFNEFRNEQLKSEDGNDCPGESKAEDSKIYPTLEEAETMHTCAEENDTICPNDQPLDPDSPCPFEPSASNVVLTNQSFDDTDEPRQLPIHALTMLAIDNPELNEPKSYAEATEGPNKDSWLAAIKQELDSHETNKTWKIVDRPKEGTTLTTKWVFKIKYDLEGRVERFKARLVARGYRQKYGLDYQETYAPVARMESVRVLLVLAAVRKWTVKQFDVTTAFLNGVLEEDVFIEPPQGISIAKTQCLKLVKSLYGLKQAPRAWSSKFNEVVTVAGFRSTHSDPCVYFNQKSGVYLSVYVDDGLIIGPSEQACNDIIQTLNKEFKTKEVITNMFLGCEIHTTKAGFLLKQTRYIEDMLNKFSLSDSLPATSPMADTKELFHGDDLLGTEKPYRAAIGSLLYLALNTRPDILHSVILLARFNAQPKTRHWRAVTRVMRYLKGTKDQGLVLAPDSPNLEPIAYTDADWAGDLETRKSTTGIVLQLSGCTVSAISRLQRAVGLSTCEAEFVAASEGAKELLWLKNLLTELELPFSKPILYVDNIPAIKSIKNTTTLKGLRHVELKYKHICDEHASKNLELKHISTEQQKADLLTKSHQGRRLTELKAKIGVKCKPEASKSKLAKAFLLFALITLVIPQAPATALEWSKSPAVIWMKTSDIVDTGLLYITARYDHASACKSMETMKAETRVNSTQAKAWDRLHDRCNTTYNVIWDPAWNDLELAVAERSNERHHSKRFVDPISLSVVTISTAVTAGLYFLHPQSPHYRIPELQRQLNGLENELNIVKSFSNSSHQVALKVEKTLDLLVKNVGNLEKDVHETNLNAADMAWMAAEVHFKITQEAEWLKDITRSYRTRGKVPLKSMSRLLRMPGLLQNEDRFTNFIHIKIIAKNIVEFGFSIRTKDPTTRVMKANPFNVIKDFKKERKILKYSGPTYAVYNRTSNCTTGVDEPVNGVVVDECNTKDYYDAKLKSWTDTGTVATKDLPPSVKKLSDGTYISCIFHKISIDGEKIDCPAHPFKIAPTRPFSIRGIHHNVTHQDFQTTEETKDMTLRNLNESLIAESSMPEKLELLEEIHQENQKSERLLAQMESHLMIPTSGVNLVWTVSGLGIAWLASIICCIGLISCIRRAKEDSTSGTVTVNNTTNIVGQIDQKKGETSKAAHDPKTCKNCIMRSKGTSPTAPAVVKV